MRNMSFSHTYEQMRDRSKTVTRRIGWLDAKVGQEVMAIKKGQGLKKGERVVPIGIIRFTNVRRERLDDLMLPGDYGVQEMIKEGFPGLDPQDFILRYFTEWQDPSDLITRIEFEHQ